MLVHLLPDGRLGRGGQVRIGGSDHTIGTALFSGDGTILVAMPPTSFGDWSNGTPRTRLVRYLPDGRLDRAFGAGGMATIASTTAPIAFQRDGKILAVGSIGGAWALARYTASGALDSTFGDHGTVVTSFGPGYDDYSSAVAIQSDGKIVAGGSHSPDTGRDPTREFLALARYTADGRLDASFGSGGKVVIRSLGGPVDGLAMQKDGKIVAAAHASPTLRDGATTGFVLARFAADGKFERRVGASR